jgi:hypothetical protein
MGAIPNNIFSVTVSVQKVLLWAWQNSMANNHDVWNDIHTPFNGERQ